MSRHWYEVASNLLIYQNGEEIRHDKTLTKSLFMARCGFARTGTNPTSVKALVSIESIGLSWLVYSNQKYFICVFASSCLESHDAYWQLHGRLDVLLSTLFKNFLFLSKVIYWTSCWHNQYSRSFTCFFVAIYPHRRPRSRFPFALSGKIRIRAFVWGERRGRWHISCAISCPTLNICRCFSLVRIASKNLYLSVQIISIIWWFM